MVGINLGIVYLHKELEVILIRSYVNVTDFVNEAVKEKIEKEITNSGTKG
jgi:putative aminopeptidase FrvX